MRGALRAAVASLGWCWLAACGPVATAGPGCTPVRTAIAFPSELRESSGVAVSLSQPGVYWTHTDSGPALFAVDEEGTILQRFVVDGPVIDPEDLALAPCPEGGSCLFLADVGDNYARRGPGDIRILRVREPRVVVGGAASEPSRVDAEVFPLRLPDGARDMEAIIVRAGQDVLLVTKGRDHPVTVYRYPGPLRPDTVELVEVQRLTERPRFLPRQVTGGAADPVGGVVALRTYESLQFYRMEADTLVPLEDGLVNLRTLQEGQGEGVGIGLEGAVVLTSEGGPAGGPGGMTLLRCVLPGG